MIKSLILTHMQTPAAALFDLDGVLVDTEGLYTEIWSDIEKAFPTGIDNFALKIKGSTLPQILESYFPDPEVSGRVVEMLKERENAMRYELFPGVRPFLAELRARRIPAAIVTSSNRAKMTRLFAGLEGFEDFFDAVLTDADTSRSKPDPECYLNAAERLGADIAECIVFEDSFNGLRAGRSSGAHVVALATTNPAETLTELSDTVISGFDGLTLDRLLSML